MPLVGLCAPYPLLTSTPQLPTSRRAMWLDRLAGQASGSGTSTPQSASRSFSPLPRRTSSNLSPYITSQRQGHSPRSSSLSLVSSESSVSLLASSRRPNGSGLKQSSTIVDHTPATLEALDKLLGRLETADAADATSGQIREEDLSLDFDFGGQSLRDFAASKEETDTARYATKRKTNEECWSRLNYRVRQAHWC